MKKLLYLVWLNSVLPCWVSTHPAHQPRVERVDPNQQPPPQEEGEQEEEGEEEEGEEEEGEGEQEREQQPPNDLEENSDDAEVSVFIICEFLHQF